MMDLYDAERMKTGAVIARGDAIPEGAYRLVIHVCLFAPDGRMLIQQRQFSKKRWPGMWDLSCGGCAQAGENSRAAVCRELSEELGIRLNFSAARPALTVNFKEGFDDVYIAGWSGDARALKLQAEEVSRVCWASLDEILDKIGRGEFVPWRPGLIKLLFEMYAQGSFAVIRT